MSFQSIESGEGVITATYGAAGGKGAASGITYDVLVSLSNGFVETYKGVKPNTRRWPDAVDTIAAQPGDTIGWFRQNGQIFFRITEVADAGVCS